MARSDMTEGAVKGRPNTMLAHGPPPPRAGGG